MPVTGQLLRKTSERGPLQRATKNQRAARFKLAYALQTIEHTDSMVYTNKHIM